MHRPPASPHCAAAAPAPHVGGRQGAAQRARPRGLSGVGGRSGAVRAGAFFQAHHRTGPSGSAGSSPSAARARHAEITPGRHRGTTERVRSAVVEGPRPEETGMFVTSESIASAALSARVRPLRVAKPKDPGVPITYGSRSGNSCRPLSARSPRGLPRCRSRARQRLPGLRSPRRPRRDPPRGGGCWPGWEKSVSPGQKIGHIMGLPPRFIWRRPPASVASLVAHHTPVRAPGFSCGWLCGTSSTIVSTVVPAKVFLASCGCQEDRSTAVPLAMAPLTIASRSRST